MEFQRGPNSALYGSDALASVVSLTMQHGDTPLPLFSYGADGGTFGTYHQDGSVGGYWKRLDYFGAYSGYGTQNSTFLTASFIATFIWAIWDFRSRRTPPCAPPCERAVAGYQLGQRDCRLRHSRRRRQQSAGTLFFGATLDNRANDRWHNLVQLRRGAAAFRSTTIGRPPEFPYDPYGLGFPSYYLGAPVTQRGANGYTITPGGGGAGRS